jgi:hypothetical protein
MDLALQLGQLRAAVQIFKLLMLVELGQSLLVRHSFLLKFGALAVAADLGEGLALKQINLAEREAGAGHTLL